MSNRIVQIGYLSRRCGINMADGDYFEFSVAHDRKYTLEHLWLQTLDDKEGTVKVGISEFVRAEYGDIVRVVLTRPEDDSEFETESDSDSEIQDDDSPGMMGSGDEVGVEDLLITVLANLDGDVETLLINSPFPCKILELNGEVEDSPDLVNDDAYGDGWCMIVKPHDFDEDQFLDQAEYIEMLNELP